MLKATVNPNGETLPVIPAGTIIPPESLNPQGLLVLSLQVVSQT